MENIGTADQVRHSHHFAANVHQRKAGSDRASEVVDLLDVLDSD